MLTPIATKIPATITTAIIVRNSCIIAPFSFSINVIFFHLPYPFDLGNKAKENMFASLNMVIFVRKQKLLKKD
jgi:hypothetical protein